MSEKLSERFDKCKADLTIQDAILIGAILRAHESGASTLASALEIMSAEKAAAAEDMRAKCEAIARGMWKDGNGEWVADTIATLKVTS